MTVRFRLPTLQRAVAIAAAVSFPIAIPISISISISISIFVFPVCVRQCGLCAHCGRC